MTKPGTQIGPLYPGLQGVYLPGMKVKEAGLFFSRIDAVECPMRKGIGKQPEPGKFNDLPEIAEEKPQKSKPIPDFYRIGWR